MKILSIESIKSIGGYDVLIPCYMYEIVMVEKYNGKNILEELVTKLIQIDTKYKDVNNLMKILGIEDRNILKKRQL